MQRESFVKALKASIFALFMCLPSVSFGGIQLTPIIAGGLASPTFVTNAGDGTNRLFITEQPGVIRVLKPGGSVATVFLDIRARVAFGGERGLLGLAFHPRYASNGRFFVYYTRLDGTIVVAEYRVSAKPNVANTTGTVLLRIAHPVNANHNGGMLAFAPDGYLYIGVGDGGSADDPPNNAQNVNVLLGKILRIDVDHTDPVTRRAVCVAARQPLRRACRAVTRSSRRLAQPVALQLRSQHTPAMGGRRRTGRARGSRLADREGRKLRLAGVRGLALHRKRSGAVHPANYIGPVFDYMHTGAGARSPAAMSIGVRRARCRQGTYVFGDFCSGEIFAWDERGADLLLAAGIQHLVRSAKTSKASSMSSARRDSEERIASTRPACTTRLRPARQQRAPSASREAG
jgi:hypothetical protein